MRLLTETVTEHNEHALPAAERRHAERTAPTCAGLTRCALASTRGACLVECGMPSTGLAPERTRSTRSDRADGRPRLSVESY